MTRKFTRKVEFNCGCVMLIYPRKDRTISTMMIGSNCTDTRKTCTARRTRI